MRKKETIGEEYKKNDVDLQTTINMATLLLPKLFAEGQYSEEEKTFFSFCRNVVENFIYREILNLDDTNIEMSFERPTSTNIEDIEVNRIREELLARLAVTYVLHQHHNRRLDRCIKDFYSLKIKDEYLMARIFSVAKKSPYYPKYSQFLCPKLCPNKMNLITEEKVFNVAQKMSLTYISKPLKLTWEAPEYEIARNKGERGFEITLTIAKASDKETYEGYILYLLRSTTNTVGDFTSKTLWRHATGLRFSGDQKLEDIAANSIQLLLFCLSLGFSTDVYNNLLKLRAKKFKDKEITIKQPLLTNREKKVLNDFLKNSAERLRCARNEADIKNKYDVVRRVLVNVSLDLIKRDMLPVVILSDEEIDRAVRAGLLEKQLVEKFYDHINGQRTFKRNLDNLTI